MKRRYRAWAIVPLGVFCLSSCSDSPIETSADGSRLRLHTSTVDLPNSNFGICGGSGTPNSYFEGVDATCLAGAGNIMLTVAAPIGLAGTVASAAEGWNFYLRKISGIRRLSVGSGGIPFTIHAASPTGEYCGRTKGGAQGDGRVAEVNVWPITHSSCEGALPSSLGVTIVHELAHVIGWGSGHGLGQGSVTSTTNGCTTFIPQGGGPSAGAFATTTPKLRFEQL